MTARVLLASLLAWLKICDLITATLPYKWEYSFASSLTYRDSHKEVYHLECLVS